MGADKDIVERLQSAGHFYATPHDAILYEAAAEIVRLRGEVAPNVTGLVDSLIQLRDADWTLNNEPMPDDAQGVLNMAIEAIRNPAPAMPNGVEADWKCIISVLEHGMRDGIHGGYNASYIKQQIKALRAADNRDAAGVCNCASGRGSEHCVVHASNDVLHRMDRMDTPAAVPAGEAVAYSVVQIGNRGAAYDTPNTHRAFTYEHQPGNIDASRLGHATNAAAAASAGDSIDRGLSLLKELQAIGFGVFQIGPPAPVQAAPQEGEKAAATLRNALKYVGYRQDGDLNTLAERAELWMRESKVLIAMQQELAARPSAYELGVAPEMAIAASGIRSIGMYVKGWNDCREATLQHRGDSQEVGRG